MAEIKPFGALRFTPKAGETADLVCPPYDIISEEERQAYLRRNARNIIRLELPREGEEPYRAAGETLRTWKEEGYLACDAQDSLYIYEETFTVDGQQNSIKGLVCRVKLEPFSAGVVLPHEETLSKAKTDRFRLMCATGCNFSSVYSLYFDSEETVYPRLERLSARDADMDFVTDDGIRHRVWQVTDLADIQAVAAGMAQKKLYIADGHHRYETALNYKAHLQGQGVPVEEDHPAAYMMMTLVHMEHPGLVVQPTHRIVHSLDAFDKAGVLQTCAAHFNIEACPIEQAEARINEIAATGEKALAFYAGGEAHVLTLRNKAVMESFLPEASTAYRQLDVNVLHVLILEQLMGIDKENMANQKNLTYTRSVGEAVEAVDAGAANCAFLLCPTKVSEIAAVAGAGEKMPQKSTYFYPKLITGHLMNDMSDEK